MVPVLANFTALREAEMLIAGGACICFFLFGSLAGGLFLWFRLRQQEADDVPAPEPPPVTRDVHVDSEAQPVKPRPKARIPPPPKPIVAADTELSLDSPPTPKPVVKTRPQAPQQPLTTPAAKGQIMEEETTIRSPADVEEETNVRAISRPLGLDDHVPDTMDPTIPARKNEPLTPITLPDDEELETPTILIDRTKPMTQDEDE
ncbi:MAG: hypothetical protein ACPGTU_00845 [Myxococcota bacterium]